MVKIGKGQTRVVFWNFVGPAILSDRNFLYRGCFLCMEANCCSRANLQTKMRQTCVLRCISVTVNIADL